MTSLCKSSYFLLLFIIFSTSCSTFAMPRLGRLGRGVWPEKGMAKAPSTHNNTDVQISYYSQTLDHFNYQPESYLTFKQKYIIYSKHWGGAHTNSPILVYIGDEEELDDDEYKELVFPDYAAQFKALFVLIEHRFYGDSIPFGMSMEDVLKNASIRGYFNSAQAIADCAELILHLKKSYKAHYSPVIVLGGSYGGMLAAWFRLKYPHITIGALASSAPVLYFDDITSPNNGYYSVVNKDYKETSESCYNTIKKSWAIIDKIGSKPNGLSFLSKKFKTCSHLNNTGELKYFLDILYATLAQRGSPSSLCKAIDRGSEGKDVLSRIYAGIASFGEASCYPMDLWDAGDGSLGYAWQTCTEMVMPLVHGTNNDSMFPPEKFDLQKFTEDCKRKYNVLPRPHWITTYYGGHDMKLILKKFGSNIIFSNGLKDPYSSAGVLENLSDSIAAVHTKNGIHCEDIYSAQEDDPVWLVDQRRREVDIMKGWISQYYLDLENYLN